MRLKPLTATVVLVLTMLSCFGFVASRAQATVPPGDSVISDPSGPPVSLREAPCITASCTVMKSVTDQTLIKLRCVADAGSPGGGFTSPLWYYVTLDTGNPETELSGYVYSAYVADVVSTPNCEGGQTDYSWIYPEYPGNGYLTISLDPDNPGVITVNTYGISIGPATLYCHLGSTSDPDTGGQVTDLGTFNFPAVGLNATFTVPLCGSGTQWIGIIAYDGIIRYSQDRITIGSSAPPGIVASDNDGQLAVQLANFPLGTSYYFCHAGDPSGYPTGGTITSHGSFTVSSPNQSWASGLCSGTGNFWIGIQATDGNSYYSNEVALSSVPPGISIGNNNGQMAVQLVNFPLGTSYYFCHAGDPSGYPTGGSITSHGSFTVSSPNQSWASGLCSGTGNFWIGIQAADGNSYYSNEVALSSVPPGISIGNNNGQMAVQLVNFPLGTSYYFCHAGDPSGYPTGGTITSHGSFAVSSANQSWASGLCSGTGNSWIGIQATDGNSYYSNQAVLGPPPAIATTGLPGGVLAKPYSAAVRAGAGTGSFRWSVTGGALPKGLSLAAGTGAITGTPKASGTFTVVIQVTDADQYAASRQFTLRVAALGVKTTTLPVGAMHKAYKGTLAAYGGKAPLTWSISGGHLPPGLKLSKSGVISGIPTKTGAFAVTVKVTDAASTKHAATRTLTLTIKK